MGETLAAGTVLNDRYTVLSILGQGGMSNVYLVEDAKLHSRWAVKEMLDQFITDDRTQLLEQFKKEARILASLKHPNLPRVFDCFEQNNRHYLVMEFIEGKTIREVVETTPAVPLEKIIDWAIQICDVLSSLHEAGIIYRDLKPGNIMVDENNRIYLVDFGIARLFTGGKIHDTIIIGTPGYASPEHHGRAETDARSDIFSLGATLHHVITGEDPGIIPFVFKTPSEMNREIPENLSRVIMNALALDPKERFQTADEMKKQLEQIFRNINSSTTQKLAEHPEETPPDPQTSTKTRHDTKEKKISADSYEPKPISPPAKKVSPPSESGTNNTPARPPFYGTETFTFDPIHAYVYPMVFSGGFISSAGTVLLLLTGGVLTIPVLAVSAAAVLPGAYVARQIARYVNKNSEPIKIDVSGSALEISQGKRFARIPWDDVTGLLECREKSLVGLPVNKYKIFTNKGDFEYDETIGNVKRFNDIVITHGLLQLKGESEGYRRYTRINGEE